MFKPKSCKSFFSDQELPSAISWIYLTKRERKEKKSAVLYHFTDIPVKVHSKDLVASILEKNFQDTNDITAENDHICNHVGKITPFSVSNLD